MSLFFSWLKYLGYVILVFWCGLLLAQKIDLPVADLGRHLTNGSVMVHGTQAEKYQVLYTNFYSYAEPEHTFINHHWLSGVVFYWIYVVGGFVGLSVFYIGLVSLAFGLALKTAEHWSSPACALGVGILVLPLIAQRAEIRPEGWTYLFLVLFYWLLSQKYIYEKSKTWVAILPGCMLLWVNFHIGFIFGFLILGCFWLEKLWGVWQAKINNSQVAVSRREFYILSAVFAGCGLAGLINPFGWHGIVYPLNIFREYGYRIVENQSVSFLENLGIVQNMHFGWFKFLVVLTILSFVGVAIKHKVTRKFQTFSIIQFGLWVVITFLAYMAIRNFPVFGFIVLPILAKNIYELWPKSEHLAYKIVPAVIVGSLFFFGSLLFWRNIQTYGQKFGVGLLPGVEAAAEFYKTQQLAGPVFNNYDIGGYLIYGLSQTNRRGSKPPMGTEYQVVYTDNRPEAYSLAHFQTEYIPAQEDDLKWQDLMHKYQFNVIFFSRRDLTPWGQKFLVTRIQDALWAPVFVDAYNIIFMKRDNPANAEIIKKFELPKNLFGLSQN